MIFQSFILENLVFLCMKIINSIVVVGLYYGFMTTFSIGPSYLFLLRARLVEEGTEKKIAATTGFITGQLIMFMSIYYAPLHLALGRPHTITVIAIPYLLFQFFGNSQKKFLNYGYKNPNSIRNFSIQRRFFQNLLFQFLNPLFLPSSIFMRFIKVYLFRCYNKITRNINISRIKNNTYEAIRPPPTYLIASPRKKLVIPIPFVIPSILFLSKKELNFTNLLILAIKYFS